MKLEPIIGHLERLQLNWYGHVNGMMLERILGKVLETKPGGKRIRVQSYITGMET